MNIWKSYDADSRGHSTQQLGHSALLTWRRRQHLIFVGYSETETLRLGDLAKLTSERMLELMHSNNVETTKKTGEELNKTTPNIPAFSDNPVDMPVVTH